MITSRLRKNNRSRQPGPRRRRTARSAVRLPSWRELARREALAAATHRSEKPRLSVRRLMVYVLAAAALFTGYVWHVYATREALQEVQRLRREHLQLVLEYNRLRGELDRATSPAVVYERARALGLEEGFTYGPVVIRVKP